MKRCHRCGEEIVSAGVKSSLSPKTGEFHSYHEKCARISAFASTLLHKLSAFDEKYVPEFLAETALEMGVLSTTQKALRFAMDREDAFSDFEKRYREAFLFAARHHVSQRYGASPYTSHLEDVARTIVEFGFSPTDPDLDKRALAQDLCIAALLHDTLEDTNAGYEDIRLSFGQAVADIVLAVTNEAGKNRREKFARTYPKIRANPKAVAVKLADRISNGRACSTEKKLAIFRMYQDEWPGFEAALRRPGEFESMWECLERLFGTGRYKGM